MGWATRGVRRLLLIGLALAGWWVGQAHALPPGRAWTPAARLNVPSFDYLAGPRLDTDPSGVPVMAASAIFGPQGDDAFGFRWADTTWVTTWQMGQGTLYLYPVLSPPGTYHLVWNGGDPPNADLLFMNEVVGGALTPPDTVTHDYPYTISYGAAVSARRRWVAVSDLFDLRLFYSDMARQWREVQVEGKGQYGIGMAALDDTTVIVAWAGLDDGLSWGILRGATWYPAGTRLAGALSNWPRFRPRPSGGFWMSWGTVESHVEIATYRDGAWSPPESLKCAFREAGTPYSSYGPDLSREGAEYPAVAWAAQSDRTAITTVCACVPTDSGWAVAEEMEGSAEGGSPTVARDANGDVWLAWWKYYDGTSWLHTYTTATTSTPTLRGVPSRRVVSWTLSEPAPETWWAVLRAAGSGSYQVVARVRAGQGQELSWTDAAPPPGAARYRVRRECVDTRYRWESDEVSWPAKAKPTPLAVRVQNPAIEGAELHLTGAAAGPVDVSLYDTQGRRVMRTTYVASGSGEDTLRLDLSAASPRPSPGIYLLRVVDAGGRASEPVKLVILR